MVQFRLIFCKLGCILAESAKRSFYCLLLGSIVTHPKTGQTIATITALTMILVGLPSKLVERQHSASQP